MEKSNHYRKQFKHELYPKLDINNHDTPNGRFYSIPNSDELLPSVTTVLDRTPYFDRTALEKWRKKPGSEQILQQARNRGSAVHELLEKYVSNNLEYDYGAMPYNVYSFRGIKDLFDKHAETIYGIELPLYSLNLKTAGRSDIILDWNGKKTVFDLKTSRKIKTKENIPHYFVQATCYALMMNEIYNEEITDIVIAMIIDHESPIIFNDKVENYVDLTNKIFKERTHEIICNINHINIG